MRMMMMVMRKAATPTQYRVQGVFGPKCMRDSGPEAPSSVNSSGPL